MEVRNRMLDQAHNLFHYSFGSETLRTAEAFDKLVDRKLMSGLNNVPVVPQQLKLRNST